MVLCKFSGNLHILTLELTCQKTRNTEKRSPARPNREVQKLICHPGAAGEQNRSTGCRGHKRKEEINQEGWCALHGGKGTGLTIVQHQYQHYPQELSHRQCPLHSPTQAHNGCSGNIKQTKRRFYCSSSTSLPSQI